jgi:hypothetical protein
VVRWAKTEAEEKTTSKNKEKAIGSNGNLGLFSFIATSPSKQFKNKQKTQPGPIPSDTGARHRLSCFF